MSLESFQRALCDLVASPDLCLAVREDSGAALAAYTLTARERERLAAVVWQRGMSTNCTLYRSNRITPVYTLLPFTCRALGGQFQPLIEAFWRARVFGDGQFLSEVDRFGMFLRRRIAEGGVASPFAGELLAFELARNELAFLPRKAALERVAALPAPDPAAPCALHPLARAVAFSHDPVALLDAAAAGALPTALPERAALVVLSVVTGALTVLQIPEPARLACRLTAEGGALWPLASLAPDLARAGLLVAAAAGGTAPGICGESMLEFTNFRAP